MDAHFEVCFLDKKILFLILFEIWARCVKIHFAIESHMSSYIL